MKKHKTSRVGLSVLIALMGLSALPASSLADRTEEGMHFNIHHPRNDVSAYENAIETFNSQLNVLKNKRDSFSDETNRYIDLDRSIGELEERIKTAKSEIHELKYALGRDIRAGELSIQSQFSEIRTGLDEALNE